MNGPTAPALAALQAGIGHVGRHAGRGPAGAQTVAARLLQLRVALNILRELDTLLGHAVTESAARLGVPIDGDADRPGHAALFALRRALDPDRPDCALLLRAARLRAGLAKAVLTAHGVERYRIDRLYPVALGAVYARIAEELARLPLATAAVAQGDVPAT